MSEKAKCKSSDIYGKYIASYSKIMEKQYDHEGKLKDFSELGEQLNLEQSMIELYESSLVELFYWDFCSLNTYEYHYTTRSKDFKIKYLDSIELDFVDHELHSINKRFFVLDEMNNPVDRSTLTKDERLHLVIDEEHYPFNLALINHELAKNIFISQRKKIKFLENKKEELLRSAKELSVISDEILEDYSKTSNPDKIVFLKELGVLDFLQNKMNQEMVGFSVNKLAQVISSFTGINQGTAQSYLNPMFSNKVNDKNDPYRADRREKVGKVIQNIHEMGFSSKKST